MDVDWESMGHVPGGVNAAIVGMVLALSGASKPDARGSGQKRAVELDGLHRIAVDLDAGNGFCQIMGRQFPK